VSPDTWRSATAETEKDARHDLKIKGVRTNLFNFYSLNITFTVSNCGGSREVLDSFDPIQGDEETINAKN